MGDAAVSLMDAFRSADEVLLNGVQGITDLITTPGLINVDFADVKGIMSGAGTALMGIGSARGDGRRSSRRDRDQLAAAGGVDGGAQGVLMSIAGGSDLGCSRSTRPPRWCRTPRMPRPTSSSAP